MMFLFLGLVLLLGCSEPDVRDSFGFVDVGIGDLTYQGSGFMSDRGVFVTSCHLFDGVEIDCIIVGNMDGMETEATLIRCDTVADIAFVELDRDIFTDALEVGPVGTDDVFEGCFVGRGGRDTMKTICSPAQILDREIVEFFGKTAKNGMSGGPCVRDGVAFGVIKGSLRILGADHDEITPGVARCAQFDASGDIFFDLEEV